MEMCFGTSEGIENSLNIPDCPINVLFKDPVNYIRLKMEKVLSSCLQEQANSGAGCKDRSLKDGKDVLIVGHGAMNSSIVCQIKNERLKISGKAELRYVR